MVNTITALQLTCTLAMVGLIWFVQLVHYPLFSFVDQSRFAQFEQAHQRRTTIIVAPLMAGEALLALTWLWVRPEGVPLSGAVTGVLLVIMIWLSTFLLQVPLHERLAEGYDDVAHRRLVQWNWLRTVAWTVRGLLVVWMSCPSQLTT